MFPGYGLLFNLVLLPDLEGLSAPGHAGGEVWGHPLGRALAFWVTLDAQRPPEWMWVGFMDALTSPQTQSICSLLT